METASRNIDVALPTAAEVTGIITITAKNHPVYLSALLLIFRQIIERCSFRKCTNIPNGIKRVAANCTRAGMSTPSLCVLHRTPFGCPPPSQKSIDVHKCHFHRFSPYPFTENPQHQAGLRSVSLHGGFIHILRQVTHNTRCV